MMQDEIERRWLVDQTVSIEELKQQAFGIEDIYQGYLGLAGDFIIRVRIVHPTLVRVGGKVYTDQTGLICQDPSFIGYTPPISETPGAERSAIPEEAFLTFKGPSQDGRVPEFEWPITQDEAQELMSHTGGAQIHKTRYTIHLPGPGAQLLEVDVFHGKHHGLVIAEMELLNPNDPVTVPVWCSKEITGDKKYSNFSMAHCREPFAEIWKYLAPETCVKYCRLPSIPKED